MVYSKNDPLVVKMHSDEVKLEAYLDYCRHIAEGKCKEAWFYEKDGKLLCVYKTMEKYIKSSPELLPVEYKEQAESAALAQWESKGVDMMIKDKGNAAIYQIMMRNKFGWDKKDRSEEVSPHEAQLNNLDSLLRANYTMSKTIEELNKKLKALSPDVQSETDTEL